MGKAFDSIKQGLTEAIVHRKGQSKGVKIHTPTEIDVQALRTRLGLTGSQVRHQSRHPAALGTRGPKATRTGPGTAARDRQERARGVARAGVSERGPGHPVRESDPSLDSFRDPSWRFVDGGLNPPECGVEKRRALPHSTRSQH